MGLPINFIYNRKNMPSTQGSGGERGGEWLSSFHPQAGKSMVFKQPTPTIAAASLHCFYKWLYWGTASISWNSSISIIHFDDFSNFAKWCNHYHKSVWENTPPHIQTHTLYKILCARLQIIIIPTPSSRQPLIYFLFYLLGTFHINKSIQSVGSASVFPTFHNVFKYLRLIQDIVCDQSSFLFF